MKLQTIHNALDQHGYTPKPIEGDAFDVEVNGFTFRVSYSSMGYQVSNGMDAQQFDAPIAAFRAVCLLGSFADALISD